MKLRECPFCGGEAELHPTYDIDINEVDGWFAWCAMGSDCAIKPQTDAYLTEAEAIEAWNERAERTCHETMIDKFFHGCDSCGYMWQFFYSIGKRERPNYCPNCGAKVIT